VEDLLATFGWTTSARIYNLNIMTYVDRRVRRSRRQRRPSRRRSRTWRTTRRSWWFRRRKRRREDRYRMTMPTFPPTNNRPLTSSFEGTPSPPRRLRRPRQRRLPPHQEPHPRRIRLRRKAHLHRILRPTNGHHKRRHTSHQDRIPCLEPLPLEARRRDSRRLRRHLHQARCESPLPRRCIRHLSLARRRHRRTRGHGFRCRVLAPLRARSHQHGYAPHERHSYHRRRAPPASIPYARLHGRRHLRGRSAARSGSYCWAERTSIFESRWGDRGFREGELHR